MKTKLYTLNLLALFLIFSIINLNAQVTIGAPLGPEDGAILELKEYNAVNPVKDNTLSLENASKGLLFPKVSLKAWYKLTPLYGGEEVVGIWTDPSTDLEKLLSTGMVVYNVNPDAENLEAGLYVWNGSEWIPLMRDTGGNAQYSIINCGIETFGTYKVDQPLNPNTEYVTVEVVVSKEGVYDFQITTSPENGYYFSATGKFLQKGTHMIKVTGGGTPKAKGDNTLRYWINGKEHIPMPQPCEKKITVEGKYAEYTFNCATDVTLLGNYEVGKALDASNKIRITLNVPPASNGLLWSFDTGQNQNGYKFAGQGTLVQGIQVIELQGQGLPRTVGTNTFKLVNNSVAQDDNCEVDVDVEGEKSNFTFNCASINVQGTYVVNHGLTSNNYIDIQVTSSASEAGKVYELKTDSKNGYSFQAVGRLKGGTETIRLIGNGTPQAIQNDEFTITGNTIDPAQTCKATVVVVRRKIKIACFGSYWYNLGGGERTHLLMRNLIDNPKLFGKSKDSIFKLDGYTLVTGEKPAGQLGNIDAVWLKSGSDMANIIQNTKPDIIMIMLQWKEDAAAQRASMPYLIKFVEQGGVLIFCDDFRSGFYQGYANLINGICGTSLSTGDFGTYDLNAWAGPTGIPWNTASSHPSLKGPFLDLTQNNLHMMRDGSGQWYINQSKVESNPNVEILASWKNSQVRILGHKTKGFMLIADGGPFSGCTKELGNVDRWPLKINTGTNEPIIFTNNFDEKNHYYDNAIYQTTNAHFFCNTMAWAINKALETRSTGEEGYSLF
ncbi:hypothetical protein [Prevotella sp. 10(H)]|uniref:hypothetical protein n=1 Tax=Prevotella sp. 10(H) TaxID=1158294 RepID=UPI0004A71180|nr:hypothetical protein [Prevotella sp. 10(H)]